jgi:hypothetical protein
VLLAVPPSRRGRLELEPAWFVNDCPLDPNAAVEAMRKRHGFASRTAALRALRKARDELRAAKHAAAAALDDLPAGTACARFRERSSHLHESRASAELGSLGRRRL